MELYDSAGVDLTLVRWMLSLSISERLDFLEGSLDFVNNLPKRNGNHAIPSHSQEAQ